MSDERVVWVVENGCYSDRYVEGVYDSIEAVIAHHPARKTKPRAGGSSYIFRAGGWQPEDPDDPESPWGNGLDWGDALRAFPMSVETTPPVSDDAS